MICWSAHSPVTITLLMKIFLTGCGSPSTFPATDENGDNDNENNNSCLIYFIFAALLGQLVEWGQARRFKLVGHNSNNSVPFNNWAHTGQVPLETNLAHCEAIEQAAINNYSKTLKTLLVCLIGNDFKSYFKTQKRLIYVESIVSPVIWGFLILLLFDEYLIRNNNDHNNRSSL